ncbi:HIR1 [Candida pseudojiufengensis]|uniref:HIR1 n=1 Tax=Candida pseudojiufengensis TaxID=497109 RepID=UPI002225B6A0|nr:HIR1 [Candida pseudojiufengensis]KAI5960600.1 HIR1 [Candida pseudojiufengensis]
MQILKIPWLGHSTENKQIKCYSVAINPKGTRLATGGLDGCIKIWDTNTINSFFKISESPQNLKKTNGTLNHESTPELPDKSLQRPMCSVSRHNGAVTSLKFSPDGRWLASGSDDKLVLIWEKDNTQRPNSFGVEQEDLEHWTIRKRLVAHDNDVQDICWSPDGNLLVTVGLDRSIIIWNALTFEKIKRYDIHQSMVKGIVFDPANKYFATASDDRTVRIFRYHKKLNEYNNYEFQMEHVVTDPFKKSPLTSYFRRMSWSPDGQHIAVPNATNGPVPSVAIVNRGSWGSDVSLIGHEAPVEVCSFSPTLFQCPKEDNFQTILATGGQDRALAIWSTSKSKPLVVLTDIVEGAITDICWMHDGRTLYFSSLDGSITCIHFEHEELGQVVSEELIDQQLNRYGADRESTILPESVEQLRLEENSKDARALAIRKMMSMEVKKSSTSTLETNPKEPEPIVTTTPSLKPTKSIDAARLRKQTITITKSGKKKVAPLLVSSSQPSIITPPLQSTTKRKKLQPISKLSQTSYNLPKNGLATAVCGIKIRGSTNNSAVDENVIKDNDNDDIGNTTNVDDVQLSESALRRQRNREKRKYLESKYPSSFKFISNLPETLFANNALQNIEIKKIYKAYANNKDITTELSTGSSIDFDEDLMFSVVFAKTNFKQPEIPELNQESKELVSTIEVRNGKPWHEDPKQKDRDFDDPTKVIVYTNEDSKRKFTLFFPFRIQQILPIIDNSLLRYYVLCSFNGSLQIVSANTGKLFCPTIEIFENVIFMKYYNSNLVIMTASGLIYGWRFTNNCLKVYMNKISIATVLNLIEIDRNVTKLVTPNVKSIELADDGTPFVLTDVSNDIYKYSIELSCWVKVVDSWYYNVNTDITNSENFKRIFLKSKSSFEKEKLLNKINTYSFENPNNILKKVMIERNQEMIEMI